MIPAPAHVRERNIVALAVVFHDSAALGDGELGCAVDARRGGLDEVSVGKVVFFEAPEEVPCGLQVVVLGVVRSLAVDLRVGGRGLCRGVDDDRRFVDRQQLVDEGLLGEVTLREGEVANAERLLGGVEALLDTRNGCRANGADLLDPLAAGEIVDCEHSFVGSVCDAQGGRPPDVAVTACDQYRHWLLTF